MIIQTRYKTGRFLTFQSELIPGHPEPQVLDYRTQQWKLFPALSLCFGLTFAAKKLWEEYEDNLQRQEEGDLSGLADLHAWSCALKALSSAECAEHVDVVRRACGGHGFMASSNLPRLWGLVTAACTYEGENTVMMLQVGVALDIDVTTRTNLSCAPLHFHCRFRLIALQINIPIATGGEAPGKNIGL